LASIKECLSYKHKSIISLTDLEQIEKNIAPDTKIQVLTSNFDLEKGKEFGDIIIQNLNRNVQYSYFIPNDNVTINQFKNIVKKWSKYVPNINETLICYSIPKESAYMSILAYDVLNTKKAEIIIKFPTSDIYSPEEFPFHFILPKDAITARRDFLTMLSGLENIKYKIEL
jgi:hypothetical protein